MELRFGVILYSKLGNENSDPCHIYCSRGPHLARGPQVPHPCFNLNNTSTRHNQLPSIIWNFYHNAMELLKQIIPS